MSLARQNFSPEAEEALNKQINLELKASYAYLSMASWCNRDTMALPGLASFFRKQSGEEKEHAQLLIDYMAKRGGTVAWMDIIAPSNEWKSAVSLMESSLEMERQVNASLLQLHAIAEKNNDPQLEDFLEQHFLEEQVDSIKVFADMVTQVKRVGGEGVGLYLFDQSLSK